MSEGKSLSLTDSNNYRHKIFAKSFLSFLGIFLILISEKNPYLLWILSSFVGAPIIDVDLWGDSSKLGLRGKILQNVKSQERCSKCIMSLVV